MTTTPARPAQIAPRPTAPIGPPLAPSIGSLAEPRRRWWLDALALLALGAFVYATGLTDHGVTNTQEAYRLTVAYEMQRAGEWLAPTRGGEPYIAKPPMIYWAIIAIAQARGAVVSLLDARLAVALAGIAGVLTTYFVARRMLADPRHPRRGDDAAWYAALALGTGILFVRAARIAELDIFLVPFVVAAIGGLHAAWTRSLESGRTHWPAIGLACLASAGAALTKGPVPTMVIALGGVAPIVAHAMFAAGRPRPAPGFRAARALLALAAASAAAMVALRHEGALEDWPGVALLALAAGWLAWAACGALRPSVVRDWWPHLRRTHPWIVLGAGLLALALWVALVRERFDPDRIAALVELEREDNLRLLVPRSPMRNIGFFAYAIAPASVAAIGCLVWLVRERPALWPGVRAAIVWTVLGMIAFSSLGKGVARYLLPVWPAVAMLAGHWLAAIIHDRRATHADAARRRAIILAIALAAAAANAWYYALGRDWLDAARSPRDFVRAMLAEHAVPLDRIGTLGFEAASLGYYLALNTPGLDPPHLYLHGYWDDGRRGGSWDQLIAEIRADSRPYWLLVVPDTPRSIERHGRTVDRLAAAGLRAVQVPVEAVWRGKSDEGPVLLLQVSVASDAADGIDRRADPGDGNEPADPDADAPRN